MSNFTTKAWIGKITEVPTVDQDDNDDLKYLVTLSVPHHGMEEKKYQSISCCVGKTLTRFFASAYGAQNINEKGHAQHSLTDHLIDVEIRGLFFKIDDEGNLIGKGFLSSLSFG